MLAGAAAAVGLTQATPPVNAQSGVALPPPRVPGQGSPEALPGFVGEPSQVRTPKLPPLPPGQRVGFALVGLGRLTVEELLPAFGQTKLCRPAALVTGDRAKGLRLAAQYGMPDSAVLTYAEYDRLRDMPEVQVAYIVLPNGMHRDYTVRAAALGKHVLCEKPMANTAAEAQAMIAACDAAQRLLMIAYRIQYEPHNHHVRRLVRSGALGMVRLMEGHIGQIQGEPGQWRHKLALAGGGALPDIGLYCLNTCRFILGEEPVEVQGWTYAAPGDPRFAEVEENCAWMMRFPSGTVAHFSAGYDSYESKRYRVMGRDGWAGMDPAFSYRGLRLETGRRSPEDPKVGLREARDIGGERDQFASEMDHMAECVLTGRRPFTPGEEGLQDQRIMEAIYRSARENRPVRLDPVPGLDAFRGTVPEAAG